MMVEPKTESEIFCQQVRVFPGNCRLPCSIQVKKNSKSLVSLKIFSDCDQVTVLDTLLNEVTIDDLFLPISQNPIFIQAEMAGCHNSCPIPVAIIKTIEVAMGIAIAQDTTIQFSRIIESGEFM